MTLQTESLQFAYNRENSFHFPDLHLADCEQQLILGQSGRGKTTFLHLLAGILRPQSGHVRIDGTDLSRLRARKLDRFRGKHIGLVFQRSYFVQSLSVKDNLLLAQKLAGLPPVIPRIREVLDELNIEVKLNARPAELSTGEQQRISIARAVLTEPSLILADEPTSALDDANAAKVADLLERTAQNHRANLVIVTHDQRLKNRFTHILQL